MTESLPEVPDWVDNKIEFDPQKNVQDHHIVDVFRKVDRPFLSRSRVEAELDSNMSDEGVRQRLLDLEDLDILESCSAAGGRIYWIQDDRSEWPIPSDVQVESSDESEAGLTVSELSNRSYVRYGVFAMLCAMLGSILISVFVVGSVFQIPLGTDVLRLSVGLGALVAFIAVLLGGVSISSWGISRWKTGSSD